jgi:hypothetical protein
LLAFILTPGFVRNFSSTNAFVFVLTFAGMYVLLLSQ